MKTRPSKLRHYAYGKVLNVSTYADTKLKEFGVTIQPGDMVYVAKQVLQTDSFNFYLDRSKTVQDFKGLICIPHTLIEAK